MLSLFLLLLISFSNPKRNGDGAGEEYADNNSDEQGSVLSPKIIKNSVTISIGGDYTWQTDEADPVQMAHHFDIPIDWVTYAGPRDTLENYEIFAELKNKISEVHNKGKLFVHYFIASNIWKGSSLEKTRPDLLNYAAIDIDGNKIEEEDAGHGIYAMNLMEDGWQNFIKSEMKSAIDAGIDGILFDGMLAQVIRIGWPGRAGVFNKPDMDGFREFLKNIYTRNQLSSRFQIDNINTFNYGDYIRQNGYATKWKKSPYEVPLYDEFRIFEYKATVNIYKKIIKDLKRYAKKKYKKFIIFLGNTSNGIDIGIPFEESLDLAQLEFPYEYYGYPPWCKIIPTSKVKVDKRWKKGTYLANVDTATYLDKRGDPPNISKIFIAETYASKSEYDVPYEVMGSNNRSYSPHLDSLAPYYKFINKNRTYYGQNWSWESKVAIFYPVSSYLLGSENSYFGAGLILFDAGIQFDVIFSGDNQIMKNRVKSKDLNKYSVIILANPFAMTDSQVNLILNYVKNGGTVVGWGHLASGNEFGWGWENEIWDSRPIEWRNSFTFGGDYQLGSGWIKHLRDGGNILKLGNDYFNTRNKSIRKEVLGKFPYDVSPEVSVFSGKSNHNINFLIYKNKSNDKLTVHILNYNYKIKKDRIVPFKDFTIKIKLPADFIINGKSIRLISPDFKEVLYPEYTYMGDSILVHIDTLDIYNLLVIE